MVGKPVTDSAAQRGLEASESQSTFAMRTLVSGSKVSARDSQVGARFLQSVQSSVSSCYGTLYPGCGKYNGEGKGETYGRTREQ